MNELALNLLAYHVWANQKLVDHLKTLPHEIFTKKIDSVFPTISHTFDHMLSVDHVWWARMNGETPEQIEEHVYKNCEELENALEEYKSAVDVFFQKHVNVSRVIVYKNTKGQEFQQTILETIQHIVNHGTYHRGNIASMIRHLGYSSTSTDYITFLRL